MIVTPQKEPAMEVNVRIEEVTTLAAVVEDMAAVTEVMEDQIAVTHPLIEVMALPLIVPGQEAMVEGLQLIGHTLQVHILEVSLKTFEFSTRFYLSFSRDSSLKVLLIVSSYLFLLFGKRKPIGTKYCDGRTKPLLNPAIWNTEENEKWCDLIF